MKKVLLGMALLTLIPLFANEPMKKTICKDGIGGRVVITNISWENNSYAEVTFYGPAKDALLSNCYPKGRGYDCDGIDCFTADAKINNSNGFTSIGIAYQRGDQLCVLSWENNDLVLNGPGNREKWRFNKGCQ